MFCTNCGKEISDMAEICPSCGVRVKNINKASKVDVPSTGLNLIACCFPIVGIVLYFVWKDEKPNSAKSVCHWAIGGVVLTVILYILSAVLGVLSSI